MVSKKETEPYAMHLREAEEQGIDDAIVVDTAKVVTAPWVRQKCRFGCAMYGTRLCCPPHTQSPEEMRRTLDSYKKAILLHRHVKKGYDAIMELNNFAVYLERKLFLDGYYKALAFVSGPCLFCKECNIEGTCRHPGKARPSMEGSGIDVYATARAYDLPIKVVKTHKQARDFYVMVLVE